MGCVSSSVGNCTDFTGAIDAISDYCHDVARLFPEEIDNVKLQLCYIVDIAVFGTPQHIEQCRLLCVALRPFSSGVGKRYTTNYTLAETCLVTESEMSNFRCLNRVVSDKKKRLIAYRIRSLVVGLFKRFDEHNPPLGFTSEEVTCIHQYIKDIDM
jgi:hypothetical protein